MLQGAEPYRFPGTNDTAVLLIHGYTGSLSELRELGNGCIIKAIPCRAFF
ncbi:hypothetical protein M5E89_07395 [Acidaminococcus intestini]|nr:hypothetical protein M5E89_07395 [Acidaminococcus intestini]